MNTQSTGEKDEESTISGEEETLEMEGPSNDKDEAKDDQKKESLIDTESNVSGDEEFADMEEKSFIRD